MRSKTYVVLSLIAAVWVLAGVRAASTRRPNIEDVILATTTSTQDSGLLDYLVPIFEKKTGYRTKTIAVGTGQALKMGEKGEADVLLTHAMQAEKPLVDAGVVRNYRLVMHNDFVITGPTEDPAKIKGKSTVEALKAVFESGAAFVSRGDDSGTNKMELELWKKAGLNPKGTKWYMESGQGMGSTLLMASEKKGYTLSDRGTYLAQRHNIKLDILVEGDPSLLNIYHVMEVNPEKFDKVNAEGAKAFVEFMTSPETQKAIGEFGRDKFGQPLFFPDAGKQL